MDTYIGESKGRGNHYTYFSITGEETEHTYSRDETPRKGSHERGGV
jgi:hypothetical protein